MSISLAIIGSTLFGVGFRIVPESCPAPPTHEQHIFATSNTERSLKGALSLNL
ncbi:unnamed protein product [Penicillium roqueforti FM164]|uniref:Uncharacterized protein n=1 Tax=Penicillium roqueforti (strain FM164) TaxID=1365484 RepID=W6QIS2_PENRF|nr:unnamed protein product [Penicillium roqueforti FM164]